MKEAVSSCRFDIENVWQTGVTEALMSPITRQLLMCTEHQEA